MQLNPTNQTNNNNKNNNCKRNDVSNKVIIFKFVYI